MLSYLKESFCEPEMTLQDFYSLRVHAKSPFKLSLSYKYSHISYNIEFVRLVFKSYVEDLVTQRLLLKCSKNTVTVHVIVVLTDNWAEK